MSDFTIKPLCMQSCMSECIMLCEKGKIIQKMSYQELYILSTHIRHLISKIADKNMCIGLLMVHNVYIPSIIISCIKEECAFMFLNTDLELTQEAVASLGIKCILTVNSRYSIKNFNLWDKLSLGNQDTLYYFVRTECVPRNFRNILCVFMTSGTTGKTKIVQVERNCIERNIESLREMLDIQPTDIIYFGTELTFDPSLIELLLALTSRSTLLIVSPLAKLNPFTLYETLFPLKGSEYKGISVLQTVPSLFRRWTIEQQKSIMLLDTLRVLAFGGEVFPVEILQYQISKSLRIFNLYGITEVSCWATICEVDKNLKEVSLGSPLSDTIVEVRNEFSEHISNGEGEIFIGSSIRKCVVDDEPPEEGLLFRATGDIATVNQQGLFYLGRKNNVIKKFGNKINLDKIESLVFKETNLINKCVWFKDISKLVVFILLIENDQFRREKIRDKLHVKLLHSLHKEEYPDSIELVPKFPVTCHGKIDIRTLQSIFLMNNVNKPKRPDDLFISLCKLHLGLNESQIKLYQNHTFFEAGGNSISAIQLLEEMKSIDKIEKLTSALFEEKLECCLDILKEASLKRVLTESERSQQFLLTEQDYKKRKYEKSMTIKWKCDLAACVDCSPLVFHYRNMSYVAVGSFSNIFMIANSLTGEEICKFVLPKSIETSCLSSISDNCLYIGCLDGNMYCLDYTESNIKWKFSTGDQIKSQPCYLKEDESVIAFGSYDKHIYALQTQNGEPVWTTYISESVACTPLLDREQNKMYIVSILGTCFCLDCGDGKIIWKYEGTSPTFTSPKLLPLDSSVIFGEVKGRIVCLRKDGQLKWSFTAGGHIFSSPVLDKDLIMFGCNDGCLYILKENMEKPELCFKVDLEYSIIATSFVCNLLNTNCVVVACQDGTMNIVNLKTGCLDAQLKLDGFVFSSPFVYENRIYVGCRDNYLYCIEVA